MTKPCFHIAIVGAGLGGLAAAIAISRAGHRVTILEQTEQLGEVRILCRNENYPVETYLTRLVPESKYLLIHLSSSSDGDSSAISKLYLFTPVT